MKKYTIITRDEAFKLVNKRETAKMDFSEKEMREYCSIVNVEIEEVSKGQSNKAWDSNGNLVLLQRYAKLIIIQANGRGYYIEASEAV